MFIALVLSHALAVDLVSICVYICLALSLLFTTLILSVFHEQFSQAFDLFDTDKTGSIDYHGTRAVESCDGVRPCFPFYFL